MVRVAGIDCGTNSIRLLIADVTASGLTDVVRTMEVVRLGQGVDKTGQFATSAINRTFAAAERYADECERHGVENLIFVATSATRDASNRDVFVAGIEERLGVTPMVISGQREAQLSFQGAISVLDDLGEDRVVAVDLGGGSTEIVAGASTGVGTSFSMNVGCVRLTERHLSCDPPTVDQQERARADVRAALDEALETVDLTDVRHIIGLAGTVTTVTARALGLDHYDPQIINGTLLGATEVEDACQWLIDATRQQREAQGYMHPGRIDVIGGGALVWQEVVRRLSAETGVNQVLTSEHDILDGIALWAGGQID